MYVDQQYKKFTSCGLHNEKFRIKPVHGFYYLRSVVTDGGIFDIEI